MRPRPWGVELSLPGHLQAMFEQKGQRWANERQSRMTFDLDVMAVVMRGGFSLSPERREEGRAIVRLLKVARVPKVGHNLWRQWTLVPGLMQETLIGVQGLPLLRFSSGTQPVPA